MSEVGGTARSGDRNSFVQPGRELFYAFAAKVEGSPMESNVIYLDAAEYDEVLPFMSGGTPEEFMKKCPIPGIVVRTVVPEGGHGPIPGERRPTRIQPWIWYKLEATKIDEVASVEAGDEIGDTLWYDVEDLVTDGRRCIIHKVEDLSEKERARLSELFQIRGSESMTEE